MEHSQEEIIRALGIIKDTCSERQWINACKTCPLSKEGECALSRQSPEEWKIKTYPSVWKAFE